MSGKIILLNGASSSGKSTLARGLQGRLDRPFWHVSIDHFRAAGVLPMPELERRERARGDRRIGEARADHGIVHTFGPYDFDVDSTLPPERNAEAVIAAWRARQRPGAFERMAQRATTNAHR